MKNVADIAQALADKGLGLDDVISMLRVIEAAQAEDLPAERPSVQRRKAYDRERKAEQRAAEKAAREQNVNADVRADNCGNPTDKTPSPLPQRDINQTPTPHPKSSLRSDSGGAVREWFRAEVWPVMPKRSGDYPAECEKIVLRKIKAGAKPEEILDGVRRYAVSREGEDPAYNKSSSAWFNQERWKGEYPARAGPRNGSGGFHEIAQLDAPDRVNGNGTGSHATDYGPAGSSRANGGGNQSAGLLPLEAGAHREPYLDHEDIEPRW